MHVGNEIFAERDKHQHAEHTAKHRTEEYFNETYRNGVAILGLKDVERREGEDGSCHHNSRRGADRLDYHVLSEGVFLLQRARHSDCDDCNRNCRLKHLPHFQSEICRRGTEDNRHHKTHYHRVGSHFRILTVGAHHGDILLARLQLAESVFRNTCFLLLSFVFHYFA